jgi:hypothetical protein
LRLSPLANTMDTFSLVFLLPKQTWLHGLSSLRHALLRCQSRPLTPFSLVRSRLGQPMPLQLTHVSTPPEFSHKPHITRSNMDMHTPHNLGLNISPWAASHDYLRHLAMRPMLNLYPYASHVRAARQVHKYPIV